MSLEPQSNGTASSPHANGKPARLEQLSPSLASGHEDAAFEIKFLLEAEPADAVAAWARRHLAYDAHGDAACAFGYRTFSLYLDTHTLDVYHGKGDFKGRKVRIRRYGDADWAFLERKTRRGDRVHKLRERIALSNLPLLAQRPLADWVPSWFSGLALTQPLRPTCMVAYQRVAHVGDDGGTPVRLTLDRQVVCRPLNDWGFEDFSQAKPLLTDQTILELKFRGMLPSVFKRLLQEVSLVPGSASKYRLALRAWGLVETANA